MRKKIGVLFGGCSSEYGVSLQSAAAVIRAIDHEAYEVYMVGISRQGEWFLFQGDVDKIENDQWRNDPHTSRVLMSPDRRHHGLLRYMAGEIQVIRLDAVFPVLHGKNGEDGTIQGLCALADIPCVGCDALSSALCMDKYKAHLLVEQAGIRVPNAIHLSKGENVTCDMQDIIAGWGYPVYVKPVKAGSSFGITRVGMPNQLEEAIQKAFAHDAEVIIEENIEGFEVGCAILGRQSLIIGQVDEIELSGGFFDFDEKYTLETSKIHMPARISPELAGAVRKSAEIIYRVLGCGGFARVDMFVTPQQEIVFNEVNTIPGFTGHSRYPNMMLGIGLGFSELVNVLIKQILE